MWTDVGSDANRQAPVPVKILEWENVSVTCIPSISEVYTLEQVWKNSLGQVWVYKSVYKYSNTQQQTRSLSMSNSKKRLWSEEVNDKQ